MNARQSQVLENPAKDWIDPGGSGAVNPKADRFAWEREVRYGLADRAQAMIGQIRPQVERLEPMLRQARARGDVFVALERERKLDVLRPELARWEALLKASAPWVGCAGKSLVRASAAAETAVLEAERPVAELAAARRTVAALASAVGVEMREVDSALGPIDAALAAKLTAARGVATKAREAVQENDAEIARLDAELARLHARRVA